MKSIFTSFGCVFLPLCMSMSVVGSSASAQWKSLPTVEEIRQIQSDFLQLEQPLNFKVKLEDDWEGVDALQRSFGAGPDKCIRIKLYGDALEFKDKYSVADIALALYPFCREPAHDAEACIILYGVVGSKIISFSTFRSRQSPGDWEQRRKLEIDVSESVAINQIQKSHDRFDPIKAKSIYRFGSTQLKPSSLKKKKPS